MFQNSMIESSDIICALKGNKYNIATGLPCSNISDLVYELEQNVSIPYNGFKVQKIYDEIGRRLRLEGQ